MLRSRKQAFHNHSGKRREPPPKGLFLEKSKSFSEGLNENSPFFIWRGFIKKRSPPNMRKFFFRRQVLIEAPEGEAFGLDFGGNDNNSCFF